MDGMLSQPQTASSRSLSITYLQDAARFYRVAQPDVLGVNTPASQEAFQVCYGMARLRHAVWAAPTIS